MNNLGKIKMIIKWQVTRNIAVSSIKIDQSVFVRDLIIKKKLIAYNVNIILIKPKSTNKMLDLKYYNWINIQEYYRLIDKLIYLVNGINQNIAFAIG